MAGQTGMCLIFTKFRQINEFMCILYPHWYIKKSLWQHSIIFYCFGQAVKQACETLLKTMEPHKKEGMSWKEVVQSCQSAQVDLHAKNL